MWSYTVESVFLDGWVVKAPVFCPLGTWLWAPECRGEALSPGRGILPTLLRSRVIAYHQVAAVGIGFYQIPPGMKFLLCAGCKDRNQVGFSKGQDTLYSRCVDLLPTCWFFPSQVLSSLGYHVVTFDYRGEGSFESASLGLPTSSSWCLMYRYHSERLRHD